MIKDLLIAALGTAGCTVTYYENDQLANVKLDQLSPDDLCGMVIEPTTGVFEVKGNGVQPRYSPHIVEIIKQVKPEDTADNNYATLDALMSVSIAFVNALMKTGSFKKIGSTPFTKITERKYDANVIGWSIAFNIQPITNSLNC